MVSNYSLHAALPRMRRWLPLAALLAVAAPALGGAFLSVDTGADAALPHECAATEQRLLALYAPGNLPCDSDADCLIDAPGCPLSACPMLASAQNLPAMQRESEAFGACLQLPEYVKKTEECEKKAEAIKCVQLFPACVNHQCVSRAGHNPTSPLPTLKPAGE